MIAQKQRTIPREKLEVFLKAGIIKGLLESEHARGWVHNVELTKETYDKKAIRLPGQPEVTWFGNVFHKLYLVHVIEADILNVDARNVKL